jgi:hypothetical protein
MRVGRVVDPNNEKAADGTLRPQGREEGGPGRSPLAGAALMG